MAKLTLNSALTQLRGSIDNLVVKHTPHGAVLSRWPDMSTVRWSSAQTARRQLMQEASHYYQTVMEEPEQADRFRALAKQNNIPVSAFVIGEYMRRANSATLTKRHPW